MELNVSSAGRRNADRRARDAGSRRCHAAGLAEPVRQVLLAALSGAATLPGSGPRSRRPRLALPAMGLWDFRPRHGASGRDRRRRSICCGGRASLRLGGAVRRQRTCRMPVLAHRCDNSICQRIGDGRVTASARGVSGGSGRCPVTPPAAGCATSERPTTVACTTGRGTAGTDHGNLDGRRAPAGGAQLPLWDEPACSHHR